MRSKINFLVGLQESLVATDENMYGSGMSHATTAWKRISAELSLMSHRQPNRLKDWTEVNWTELSSCTFPQACRERTFHVPFGDPSFVSLMIVFTPVAHLSPTPWNLTVGCPVVVGSGLDRSGILFLCCVFIMSSQWVEGKLGGAAPKSPRNVAAPH